MRVARVRHWWPGNTGLLPPGSVMPIASPCKLWARGQAGSSCHISPVHKFPASNTCLYSGQGWQMLDKAMLLPSPDWEIETRSGCMGWGRLAILVEPTNSDHSESTYRQPGHCDWRQMPQPSTFCPWQDAQPLWASIVLSVKWI